MAMAAAALRQAHLNGFQARLVFIASVATMTDVFGAIERLHCVSVTVYKRKLRRVIDCLIVTIPY